VSGLAMNMSVMCLCEHCDGQYEYSRLNSTRSIENLETLSRSVWQLQLGIKYDF